jgi:hypothetical protein
MQQNIESAIPVAERGPDTIILQKIDREIKQAEQWHAWTALRLKSLRNLRERFADPQERK